MKDYIIDKIGFVRLVGIVALTISAVSAFFSVYGIATLFAGAFISVVIMATSLEIAKIISVVYLYRYWYKIKLFLKTYLIFSSIVLLFITSLGIFGFLSSAYQKSSLEYNLTQGKIQRVESQKLFHNESINSASARIKMLNQIRSSQESRLNEAQTNAFISRNPIQLIQLQTQTGDMIKQANDEIKEKNVVIESERQALQNIDQQVLELKLEVNNKKDIQTLKYVAEQIGWDLNRVAFWFMMAIIFVFDPLAIALILAYNVAIFQRKSSGPIGEEAIASQPKPSVEPSRELLLDSIPKKV